LKGIQVDVISQQIFNGGADMALYYLGYADSPTYNPTYDFGYLSRYMDDLGSLGKSVRISEVGIPGGYSDELPEKDAG
jgi:hypothetical protein